MLGTRLNEQRGKVSGELLSELCELVFVKGGCMFELKLADQRGKVRAQRSRVVSVRTSALGGSRVVAALRNPARAGSVDNSRGLTSLRHRKVLSELNRRQDVVDDKAREEDT